MRLSLRGEWVFERGFRYNLSEVHTFVLSILWRHQRIWANTYWPSFPFISVTKSKTRYVKHSDPYSKRKFLWCFMLVLQKKLNGQSQLRHVFWLYLCFDYVANLCFDYTHMLPKKCETHRWYDTRLTYWMPTLLWRLWRKKSEIAKPVELLQAVECLLVAYEIFDMA